MFHMKQLVKGEYMVLAVCEQQNDLNFAISFDDASLLDKVKELACVGLGAWYQAAHNDKTNEYFTEEEIDSFYWDGYAEPTSELLDRFGIKHEIIDIEVDEDDNIINCDEVMWL